MVQFTFNGHNYNFRRPILGNTDEIAFQRINRKTRGGDTIIFRDDEWPKVETLGLTFSFYNELEKNAFRQFLKETVGETISYLDHENRTWSGVIQNPDTDFAQTGRYTYNISIVFEGDLT